MLLVPTEIMLITYFFFLDAPLVLGDLGSLTRDETCGPCSGSMDHQGSSLMYPYVIPDICNL